MISVKLANGNKINSDSQEFMAGDWVQVLDPDNKELGYWDSEEWAEDPILVMGAILRCANND